MSNKNGLELNNGMPVELVPLDQNVLSEIDYDRAKLTQVMEDIECNVRCLAANAMKLDIYDARKLGCSIQAANIQHTATSIRQYLGIARMLLDNVNSDMRFIYNRRKDFQRDFLLRLVDIQQAQRDKVKREADAKRIAQKRAAEDPEIKEIQEKKGRRIKHN